MIKIECDRCSKEIKRRPYLWLRAYSTLDYTMTLCRKCDADMLTTLIKRRPDAS